MSYITTPPCEELKEFVSHFWVAEWDESIENANSTYYITANSLTEIAFGFNGTELLFSSIQGQTSHHGQFPAGGFYHMFGVSLYSHAIPFLFHLQAQELNNKFLTLDTLFGMEGEILNEKIALAASTPERISILTEYFLLQLRKQKFGDKLISNAAQQIRQFKGNLNIADLSNTFCLSQKQFERRFKANTGFNPKLYARIIRFENILKNHSTFNNFTDAAYANGYYDQAHFIHDFKTFAGYSPNKFFALNGY